MLGSDPFAATDVLRARSNRSPNQDSDTTVKKLISTALGGSLLLVLAAASAPPETGHFGLSRSSPEAGSTVEAPGEVRLWFTQVPQDGTVQVRIVEAADAGVHVMDAVQDGEEPQVFYVEVHGSLPPATYTVSWRGMGEDGHVVRDTFEFTVATR